jgi:hypothetical protein
MRKLVTGIALMTATAGGSLHAGLAWAAPPGDVSLAVERVFGFRRTSVEAYGATFTDTTFSVGANVVDHGTYSSPRLALDYLAPSGITFGGAIGYQTTIDGNGDAWLLAPRVGYFARASAGFGIWPRAGFTLVGIEDGSDSSAVALTLEAPLEFLVNQGFAITLTPHADIGIGGHDDQDEDQTITELGLQFGVNAFF